MPSPTEEYLFDLRGYTIVEQAIDAEHVRAINDCIDALPKLESGAWHDRTYVHTYGVKDGTNLQDIIEGGEIFERLIDHPAWIGRVRHFLGSGQRPFLNEGFLNIREAGGYIGVHSGGHVVDSRVRAGHDRGGWCCCMLSLMVALTDVGPGDGATVVVPGSHKSHLPHPQQDASGGISDGAGQLVDEAMEVHLKAGDALVINDALCHGASERTNSGERRMVIFRYVPEIYRHRFGYEPSDELMSRLTPARREIVFPNVPRRRSAG